MGSVDDKSEIAFFDVETTIPTSRGQGYGLLEFGAILVCPRKLVELHNYSTLVQPSDLSLISTLSVRCNGISKDAVLSAPSFIDIADRVYDILHGRIWAGHNIVRFDCVRIREAFAAINRPPPEPKGLIDSLTLLTQRFGRRAGDMKMASLATYFGLGQQSHRSLDDVRMNLEVLKYCATVLFLESSLPDIFMEKSWVSPNATARGHSNARLSPGSSSHMPAPSTVELENSPIVSQPSTNEITVEGHPIFSFLTNSTEASNQTAYHDAKHDAFDMRLLTTEIEEDCLQPDIAMEDKPLHEGCSGYAQFLEPEEISVNSIKVTSLFCGSKKVVIKHNDVPLQLLCTQLKVRFGISTKFLDYAGRPRLSVVVDAPPSLCSILEACNDSAQRVSTESISTSEWRHVMRKDEFYNHPTVRLNIPTIVNGDTPMYATEIYQKESSGQVQRLLFSRFDASELKSLLACGTFVDAYLGIDSYDYQQSAGIRLVAKKLVIHSN